MHPVVSKIEGFEGHNIWWKINNQKKHLVDAWFSQDE